MRVKLDVPLSITLNVLRGAFTTHDHGMYVLVLPDTLLVPSPGYLDISELDACKKFSHPDPFSRHCCSLYVLGYLYTPSRDVEKMSRLPVCRRGSMDDASLVHNALRLGRGTMKFLLKPNEKHYLLLHISVICENVCTIPLVYVPHLW